MKRVYNFLEKDIKLNSNDKIVVGVSAGPDSMCLLYILEQLRKKLDFKIIVAHVNHKLRKESEEEAVFLRNYCEKHNLVFEYLEIEKWGDDNFHNEARKMRYNFYKELVEKYEANYIMTGHHGDDLIETIIMRITRGATMSGYSGFSTKSNFNDIYIIRPLIFVTKDQILDYDEEHNIEYRIDKSNFKDKYTRNRYRKSVLPFLKEEEENVHEKFLKFSNMLKEYDEYIDSVMKKELKKVYVNDEIIIPEFIKLEHIIQVKIVEHILKEIYTNDLLLINDKHIDLFIKGVYSNKSNVSFNLPNNYLLVKAYDKMYVKKNVDSIDTYDMELEDLVTLNNGMVIEKDLDCSTNGNDVLRLNSKDIVLPLRVRTRKDGERIKVLNGGTKKIKDIFIDKKIPKDKRDTWPVVVDSNDQVVWIPKIKKSKFNRLKTDDCDIIFKCY